MSDVRTLNKTKNWFRCVGTVSEKDLKLEDCKVKIYDNGKPTGEEVKAQCIKGKVAIKTDTGIQTFGIYFTSKGMDGKDSKDWGMAKAMYEKWNPEIGGESGVDPTVVALEGAAEINDYAGDNGISSRLQFRVRRANTRVSPDEGHGMTLNATAYIHKMAPEVRNEEETGRMKVTLYGANAKGACFPIDMIVEEDLAEDFEEAYEVGQTVNFDIDIVVKHVGGAKSGKKAFGKGGRMNVNSGFDVTEYVLAGCDEAIEEPDELTTEDEDGNEVPVKTEWINPVAMKKAIKARAAMLEELAKNGNVPKSGEKSIKERKAERKAGGLGKTNAKPKFDEDEDEGYPDVESEDPF